MDYAAGSKQQPTATSTGQLPPIPRQTRQSSRRKAIDPSMHLHLRNDDKDRAGIAPASPEVISSLITSLSVISKPANKHFEGQSLSLPNSPRQGSFGVEYGAYSASKLGRLQEEIDLDELAASPPTIRTAKPPSGFSPLTAPKSPRRESSGGLKSLLRNSSRPSSKGSVSSHDDTRSIGNLSVERGVPPTPELRKQRSHDSWGKKQARSQKGLMYMSSKERLRASESERKRASSGSIGQSNSLNGLSPRPDTILAETPIREEPSDSPTKETMPDLSPSVDSSGFQRPIPARDSSLRKTGTNAKRSSHRSSRTKRDSEGGLNDTILEGFEHNRSSETTQSRRRHSSRANSEIDTRKRRDDSLPAEMPHSARVGTSSTRRTHESNNNTHEHSRSYSNDANGLEDGAPFPAVSQGRRRSAHSADRRRSGRATPDPVDVIKPKRSSSRLKRLSAGPKSPEPTDRMRESATPEPMVGYERPMSADSIDDAVESYLCSPRLSQKIRHPQTGRVISFSEVGDAEGSAVFCCVGMGLTRYITAFYDELALTLKLRLITPDRPGVGDSEAYADGTATPLSWPDDVYAICQALKITKFSILAHSAGAIYALATALRMPQHIRGRIHLLAPWIPPSQMNVFGTSQALPPTNAIPTSQRILRALPTPFLKAANSSFMSATSSSITSSLPKTSPRRGKRKSSAPVGRDAPSNNRRDITPNLDKENIAQEAPEGKAMPPSATENMDRCRPADDEFNPQNAIIAAAADAMADKERQMTYDMRLTHAIWELATTGANPAVDLLVCLERRHTIGFRYVDITRPVIIHHGSRDTRVPVENAKWLGKTMRRCEVRVLEGEGHGLMASATVMGSVLMEISKEWEDWMMLTNSKRTDERGRSVRASAR
ncbi:alpha/beta-hydrolase [Hypoxylon trugodes]|uniref:alpha/beta-hydrolase n=1 Tax=Hypoxylon trugodes TaxID=326681 RepID=UPI0021951627|nr:alpha/beta-hydrolase [Hypoxylon trugodes]KAI1386535.1 alpha/beta-hydrolase [Hypoxylon trugodes]